MLTINNVATQDKYVEALTLGPVSTAQKVTYLVANAAAIVQLAGYSEDKTIQPWSDEILITPTTGEFQRIQGMRFKSAIAGAPAQVVAQLVEPGDPVPIGGTPFTQVLTPTGGITPVGSISRVTALPATPVDQELVALQLDQSLWPGVEWLCMFNSTSGYWDVLGGSPLVVNNDAGVGLGAGVWTVTASLLAPNLGDYYVTHGGGEWQSAGANQIFYSDVGFNGVQNGAISPRAESYTGPGAVGALATLTARENGIAAGQSIQAFNNSPGGGSVQYITLKAMPIRIK